MPFQPVILLTDAFIYILVIAVIAFILWAKRHEHLRAPWRQVIRDRLGVISIVILAVYVTIGLLDSIHFRTALEKTPGQVKNYYSFHVVSLLDVLVSPLGDQDEKTYSAPFATHLYATEVITKPDGQLERVYPRLRYGGAQLVDPEQDKMANILHISSIAMIKALLIGLAIMLASAFIIAKRTQQTFQQTLNSIVKGKSSIPWRLLFIMITIVLLIFIPAFSLSKYYHIFGTDKVGHDVFYHAIKSIRTGLVIGTLTTLIMLPFAVMLGMMAGYFQGWTDDVIQYVYTTLSSVPGVLLIAAAILALQVFISNHADLFPTIAGRADLRLLALCAILGVTSWTSLCRLLRGETLKLRELNFVQASIALGAKDRQIILRHILPNLMHIIIITVVLDFSGLVLAEAVLSYVGIGVDPSTQSWGNMINEGRLELAREPIVWWPLTAAFILMFILVLAANLFADSVRDAFDPRMRKKVE